jgi:RNA polymerase sigma factor (sigma-70 family)
LEPDAVVRVLLRQRLRMAAIAAAIVRDAHAAEDVFQQVVLEALEYRSQFQDPGHVLAWSLRAVRFRAVDLARQRRLRTVSDAVLDQLEARWSDPSDDRLADNARALQRCLGELPAAARDLLRMRYDEGLPVASIAGRLGRTVDAVYKSLSRLHRMLRDCVRNQSAWYPQTPC